VYKYTEIACKLKDYDEKMARWDLENFPFIPSSFRYKMKKKPTKTMVKTLLKNGVVAVKGLTSKKGNKFEANMRYEKK